MEDKGSQTGKQQCGRHGETCDHRYEDGGSEHCEQVLEAKKSHLACAKLAGIIDRLVRAALFHTLKINIIRLRSVGGAVLFINIVVNNYFSNSRLLAMKSARSLPLSIPFSRRARSATCFSRVPLFSLSAQILVITGLCMLTMMLYASGMSL